MTSYFAPVPPRIFGHRGAAGVAPENTLPSFAVAATLGAGYLELDVHATADGAIVVLHDADVDRTTNGHGPIAELTWAHAAALDAGHQFTSDGHRFPYRDQGVRLPLLADVLREFPHHRLNIEIKQGEPPIVDAVLDELRRAGSLDRVLLAAEHDAIMGALRRATAGRVATGMCVGDIVDFIGRLTRDEWSGYTAPGNALQIPPAYDGIELVTAASVAAAHRSGLEVHVWTINDSTEIERLFDLGVDGVMSDLPGLVATAARRRAR